MPRHFPGVVRVWRLPIPPGKDRPPPGTRTVALYLPGPATSVVSGKIGGTVFTAGGFGGPAMRRLAIPRNRRTTLQLSRRSTFATFASQWSAILTPAQRDTWNIYAAGTPVTNRLGEQITLSGFNWFVAVNSIRILTGDPVETSAPATLGRSANPVPDDALPVLKADTAAVNPGDLEVPTEPFSSVGPQTDYFVLFFVTPVQLSPGQSNFTGATFNFIVSLSGDDMGIDTAHDVPFLLTVGSTYVLRMVASDPEGRTSLDEFLVLTAQP